MAAKKKSTRKKAAREQAPASSEPSLPISLAQKALEHSQAQAKRTQTFLLSYLGFIVAFFFLALWPHYELARVTHRTVNEQRLVEDVIAVMQAEDELRFLREEIVETFSVPLPVLEKEALGDPQLKPVLREVRFPRDWVIANRELRFRARVSIVAKSADLRSRLQRLVIAPLNRAFRRDPSILGDLSNLSGQLDRFHDAFIELAREPEEFLTVRESKDGTADEVIIPQARRERLNIGTTTVLGDLEALKTTVSATPWSREFENKKQQLKDIERARVAKADVDQTLAELEDRKDQLTETFEEMSSPFAGVSLPLGRMVRVFPLIIAFGLYLASRLIKNRSELQDAAAKAYDRLEDKLEHESGIASDSLAVVLGGATPEERRKVGSLIYLLPVALFVASAVLLYLIPSERLSVNDDLYGPQWYHWALYALSVPFLLVGATRIYQLQQPPVKCCCPHDPSGDDG